VTPLIDRFWDLSFEVSGFFHNDVSKLQDDALKGWLASTDLGSKYHRRDHMGV
jgi:hypothetical protein